MTGLVAILAGSPISAIVLGVTLALGKLVSTSWLYRNWDDAPWKIKLPLIYFTLALMLITSMGVFGFLSKSHLEQGAATIDNSAKVERINQQIEHEKTLIADNDKVISQMDATVNSFIGKDKADRALAVRRSQDSQRKQLKKDSEQIQKSIEELNNEKFKLESEVRKLQVEVGPIRYIAQLIYGQEANDNSSLESAVRWFILLIVSTLDPLAIVLLIAANYSLKKLEDEKKISIAAQEAKPADEVHNKEHEFSRDPKVTEAVGNYEDASNDNEPADKDPEVFQNDITQESNQPDVESALPEKVSEEPAAPPVTDEPLNFVIPEYTRTPDAEISSADIGDIPVKELIQRNISTPWMAQSTTLRELLGTTHEEETVQISQTQSPPSNRQENIHGNKKEEFSSATADRIDTDRKIPNATDASLDQEKQEASSGNLVEGWESNEDSTVQTHTISQDINEKTHPKALSWLNEFRRNSNGK